MCYITCNEESNEIDTALLSYQTDNILSILLAVKPFTVLFLETFGFIKIYLQQIEKKLPEVKISSSAFPYVDNY